MSNDQSSAGKSPGLFFPLEFWPFSRTDCYRDPQVDWTGIEDDYIWIQPSADTDCIRLFSSRMEGHLRILSRLSGRWRRTLLPVIKNRRLVLAQAAGRVIKYGLTVFSSLY